MLGSVWHNIKSIMKIILVLCLLVLALVQGQQVCLHQECQK